VKALTMKSKKEIESYYANEEDTLARLIKRLKQRNVIFIAAELASFIFAVAFVALLTVVDGYASLFSGFALLAFIAYLGIRHLDTRNSNRIETLDAKRIIYERELCYLHDDFSHFDNGKRYVDQNHEYTFDMDIFGELSLYNRLCRAVTTGGADRLAKSFAKCALNNDNSPKAISQRREAITELAGKERWRVEFMSYRKNGQIDTAKLTDAIDKMKATKVGAFALNPVSLALAWVSLAGFWATTVLYICSFVNTNIPIWWGILQFFVVYMLCTSSLRSISKVVGQLHNQFKSYIGLMELIANLSPQSGYNRQLVDALKDGNADALHSFSEMKSILDSIDRRGNVLGMMLFNILFLSDFFLVRNFLYWQRRYMGNAQKWIGVVSEMDSLVSMATFRYNEPTATDAEIVESNEIVYQAVDLRHPFLGENAVGNDFCIVNGNYYIVTGANMAGKSTFLRSLGVNYILAMMGMPVFARSLRVSVFALFSSMRTSDDLSHGISYFNAELLRLSQLIDSCKQSPRTLIILDEILKGTNSLDKLNGSRMFLEAISSLPVSGVIATHDLELSKMSDERPDRFHNYCFEISLSDKVVYNYKITPGVARNQNATFLLKGIIDPVF